MLGVYNEFRRISVQLFIINSHVTISFWHFQKKDCTATDAQSHCNLDSGYVVLAVRIWQKLLDITIDSAIKPYKYGYSTYFVWIKYVCVHIQHVPIKVDIREIKLWVSQILENYCVTKISSFYRSNHYSSYKLLSTCLKIYLSWRVSESLYEGNCLLPRCIVCS